MNKGTVKIYNSQKGFGFTAPLEIHERDIGWLRLCE